MSFPLVAFGLLSVLYWLYRWRTRISLSNIPGPDSHSWVHGNLHELLQGRAGQKDFEWSKLYGSVVRFKGPLGADHLLITDLKAIQFMFQRFPYQFVKHKARKSLLSATIGPGLVTADQDVHKRQRKIMLPAFGPAESKALVPIFNACATKMCAQLLHLVNESSDGSIVVDVIRSVSNATLDAIGQAAFDYDFGVLDDNENVLAKSYQNATVEMFAVPSKSAIMVLTLLGYMPIWLAVFIYRRLPTPSFERSMRRRALTASVSRSLVERKSAEMASNSSKSRDVLSLVVKANLAEQSSNGLYDDEMISQMQTIIGAGHETTANSLSFLFLELCKHPKMQSRLRDEIRMQQLKIQERGESEFTAKDFDDMPYLNTIIKETLRFNPVIYNLWREPAQDVVIPLSKPITTTNGQTLFELAVPQGTKIVVSIPVYNRNKELFGSDADTFNPDRWSREDLSGKKSVGVFASLMTFGAGPRSCIGWRFAVLEMQAFIVEMVKSFEFIPVVPYERVRREGALVMSPTIEGEFEKGVQLPFRIRVAPSIEQ